MTDEKKKMTAQGASVGADEPWAVNLYKFQVHYTRSGGKKQFLRKRFGGTLPEDAPYE